MLLQLLLLLGIYEMEKEGRFWEARVQEEEE